MMAMPICESIDRAKPWLNTSGSNAKNSKAAAQKMMRLEANAFMTAAPRSGRRASEAGRPHDQHQHHQQIRHHRRRLRNRDRPQAAPRGLRRNADADLAEQIQHR